MVPAKKSTPNTIVVVAAFTRAENSDRVSPGFHFRKLPVTFEPSRIFFHSGGDFRTTAAVAVPAAAVFAFPPAANAAGIPKARQSNKTNPIGTASVSKNRTLKLLR